MKISDKIHQLRKQRNLSQEQLAEMLNVSRQSVSKWESGQSLPDLDKIIPLSKIFEISTDYLLNENADSTDFVFTPEPAKNMRGINIIATSINVIGLILAFISMSIGHNWTESLFVIGWILQIIACTFYEFALSKEPNLMQRAIQRKKFYKINIWLVAMVPVFLLVNTLLDILPMGIHSDLYTIFALAFYLLICFCIWRRLKKD